MLYWSDTTAVQPFETGIQRVTRRLGAELFARGVPLIPIGWDPRRRLMVSQIDGGPIENAGDKPAWLMVPEIPMSVLGEGLDPVRLARAYGLRVAAIVHDLIPIRLAHLYDQREQAVYRHYFRMFAGVDLVFATTALVAGHLRAYLDSEGLPVPTIAVVPLPGQFAHAPRVRAPSDPRRANDPLRLLTVATWEPRKNLPGMLRAIRIAQDRCGSPIHLTLVGRHAGHVEHDAEVSALLAETPGTTARHRMGDPELARLYGSHHASVYPSCEEGFGMPVLESLWLGRPCLCHAGSAMMEVAPGGGTMLVDMADERLLAAALVRLAEEPDLLDRLTGEALERPLRTWVDYATDVVAELGLTVAAA